MEVCGGGELIRIVGSEAQADVAHGPDHDGVPSHRNCREALVPNIKTGLFFGADDGLKCVAVKMEGMSTRVVVVQYDLNYLIVFEDVRISIDTVDCGIVGEFTGGESSIECRDSGRNICYIVEERAGIASQLCFVWLGTW